MGDLKETLSCCVNVVSIRIEGCSHLSNLLAQFIAEHVPFLSRLELPGCSISDSFVVNLIRGCKALRHLDLSHTNVSLSCLPLIIQDLNQLETLDLTGVKPPVSSGFLDYEPLRSEHPERPEFKRISLAGTSVTDAIICYVTRCCPNLECILLDDCQLVTDTVATFIAQHCPRIQILGLSYCTSLTDVGLQSLAVHLAKHALPSSEPKPRAGSHYKSLHEFTQVAPHVSQVSLNELYLVGCYRITHTSICLLAENCPLLNTIVLDGCDRVLEWYFDPNIALGAQAGQVAEALKEVGFDESEDDQVLTLSRNQILLHRDMLKSLPSDHQALQEWLKKVKEEAHQTPRPRRPSVYE